MRAEWLKIQAMIDMVNRGEVKKVKKTMTKKDLQREENIKSTVERMSGFPSWVDYLKAVAAATK